jgi:trans-aconitate methyltransferase
MSKPVSPTARWNAADYAANSAAQQIWARELIAQLHLRGDERILDVGCGDGKVTAELARALPKGSVTGIDVSPEMIAFALKTFPAKRNPNLEFHLMDAREISLAALSSPGSAGVSPASTDLQLPTGRRDAGAPRRRRFISNSNPRSPALSPLGRGEGEKTARFDIVFSSSVLHWVDDHRAFLRGAASVLRPGGRLVVSCGGKGNAQDVFVALRPEMRLKRWSKFFRKLPKPYFFHSPAEYEKWLPRFGFKTHHVKLSPKAAVYPGRERFAAWFRTTWLPYTQRVPENLRDEFVAAVTDRYIARHPLDDAGRVRVRMVRLEIDAVKK